MVRCNNLGGCKNWSDHPSVGLHTTADWCHKTRDMETPGTETRNFCRSPYGWSEYKYPVVLHQHVSSFINIEDMLFEVISKCIFSVRFDHSNLKVFQSEETNKIDKIALGQFVVALENTGLRRSDPRLAEMLKKLKNFSSSDKKFLERAEFKSLIMENIVLISRFGYPQQKDFFTHQFRALRHQLIIPDFRGFTNIIELLFEKSRSVEEGKIPSYIPQLAR